MNTVMVHGSAVGPTLSVGPGAGGMATASAVVADWVEVARGAHAVPRTPERCLRSLPIDGVACPHYLKIPAIDPPGVFAELDRLPGVTGDITGIRVANLGTMMPAV